MTLVHTGVPSLTPSWVTLATTGCPTLLPRPQELLDNHVGYVLVYEELLRNDLEGLAFGEHVVDLMQQALANYQRFAQINVTKAMRTRNKENNNHSTAASTNSTSNSRGLSMPGSPGTVSSKSRVNKTAAGLSSEPEPSSSSFSIEAAAIEDPQDPLVRSRNLSSRARQLLLELEVSGLGGELEAFMQSSPGFASTFAPQQPGAPAATYAPSLSDLKALARMVLTKLAERSKSYSRFYMEVHSPSQKNSWFAGFVLAPATPDPEAPMTAAQAIAASGSALAAANAVPPSLTDSSDAAIATDPSRVPLSVLDVDLYSTTQLTLCLHSDGSTFVSGHSRRVLHPPPGDATVVGIMIDLLQGCIAYTSDGRGARTIFGHGADMYAAEEQKQQARWITSQRMRPCFGLLGPRMKLGNNLHHGRREDRMRMADELLAAAASHAADDGALSASSSSSSLTGVTTGDKAKPQRSRHALTAHSTLQASDSAAEAAGTIFARDVPPALEAAPAATSSATDTLSPDSAPHSRNSLGRSASPGRASPQLGANKANSGAAVPQTPYGLHMHHSDGLVGWVVPLLSVNLGELDFQYLPTGSNLDLEETELSAAAPPAGGNTVATRMHAPRVGFNAGLGACLAMNTPSAPLTDPLAAAGGGAGDNSLAHAFQQARRARAARRALEDKKRAEAAAAAERATQAGSNSSSSANARGLAMKLDVSSVAAKSEHAAAAPLPPPLATSIDAALADYKQRQHAAAMARLDALREKMLFSASASASASAAPSSSSSSAATARANDDRASFVAELTGIEIMSSSAAGSSGERGVLSQQLGPTTVASGSSSSSSSKLVLESWSHFPPHSLRVQQAVLKVQRLARRYIGFRARRALWHKLSRYAVRIQKCWRAYRARRNKRLVASVVPIQRLWRGFKGRKVIKLLRKYKLSFAVANQCAVRIQSFIRMLLARKKVLMLAIVVQQKIEQVKGLVIFVQRMFRQRMQKRSQMASKGMLASVLLFQARIRGIRLRRMLASIDPQAARQLRQLASSVGEKKRRFAAVCLLQRVWRGHLARKFVSIKRGMLLREAARLRDAWRAHQLRLRLERAFPAHETHNLKAFFEQLGYAPPVPPGA
jgi:hypothetical protein